MNYPITPLQKEIAERLCERLDLIRFQPQTIVILEDNDASYIKSLLRERYPSGSIETLNPSHIANRANHSADLIFSNLVLHHYPDPTPLLQQLHRILQPKGLLHFSMLGRDSLKEFTPAPSFFDMHDIGDHLLRHKFTDPVVDLEILTFEYQNQSMLEYNIKDLKLWQPEFDTVKLRPNNAGRIEATFAIIYVHAWGSNQPHPSAGPGTTEIHIPVSYITNRSEKK